MSERRMKQTTSSPLSPFSVQAAAPAMDGLPDRSALNLPSVSNNFRPFAAARSPILENSGYPASDSSSAPTSDSTGLPSPRPVSGGPIAGGRAGLTTGESGKDVLQPFQISKFQAKESDMLNPSRLNFPPLSSNFRRQHQQAAADMASSSILQTAADPAVPTGAAPFLAAADGAEISAAVANPAKATYAAVMGTRSGSRPAIPAHRFFALKPELQGEEAALSIPSVLYQKQVSEFQHALIGRVLLRKGEKPLPNIILKQELHKVWHIQNDWQLIPVGKGFFILKFSNAVDKDEVKQHLIWDISAGTIRIREWVKTFDPYREISSLCHVWVRIYYLPVECWHPEIIAGIGRHIGLPLKIDTASANGEFGHFARILVEVDLALPLPETLLINCDEGSFYVEFSYEKLPLYCFRCKITGHSLDKCKRSDVHDKTLSTAKQPEKKRPAHVVGEGKVVKKVANEEQWHAVRGAVERDEQAAAAVVRHATDMPGERNSFAILAKENEPHMEHLKTAGEVGGVSNIEQRRQTLGTMSGPDLLNAVLVPVNEDLDSVNAEPLIQLNDDEQLDGDEVDVDESIEMEGPDGVSRVLAEGTPKGSTGDNNPAARPSLGETAGQVSPQIVDIIGGVSLDGSKVPAPEDIDSRISRLEEQVSQGMQMLSDVPTKRGRGRPKGTGKGMGREPMQSVPEGCIKDRLRSAVEMGHKPRDFVVDLSNNAAMCAMNNVVHGRWSKEMDDYPV